MTQACRRTPARAALLALAAQVLAGQEPRDPGPVATREMFPLYLIALPYQPVDPVPLGEGRWRVDLEHLQANTFEFSEVFKSRTPRDGEGRVAVTRAFVEARAAEYADLPLVFFFDAEAARTSLRLRRGVGADTDLWAELPVTSLGGGRLDRTIEAFHRLGFEQFGRDRVQQDRVTLVVMQRGELRFFSDRAVRGKVQDPQVGLVHRLLDRAPWTLSLAVSVKPPLTLAFDTYRTGWEQTYAFSGRWRPGPGHAVHFGAGFVRRPRGNAAFEAFPQGSFRDGAGFHLGWTGTGRRFAPFFQLLGQSGFLHPQPGQKLDRPSLQHDLGCHWWLGPGTRLTLRYLNNLTHNENTADMGLGLGLAHNF